METFFKRAGGPPPTVNYEADHVACAGFDLRGVVSTERIERLVKLIRQLVQPRQGHTPRLLDIGCGTGRFAIPLACSLEEFSVTGADASEKMLEQARQKPQAARVNWSLQNVCSQNFESGSFDVVFLSDLLHHIDDPVAALRECFRVLRPGGWLISKYGAMENIAHDPEHRFFPGTIEVDAARTPTEPMMAHWLEQAGFNRIASQTQEERTRITAECRLAAAQAKSISVLHLISREQFQQGLRDLSQFINSHPDDPWLLVDPTTWTWGQRPA